MTSLPPHGDIVVVLGTRPEIIKLAGVIRELGPRARVVHTGQHWDDDMAGQFFRDLGIGKPHVKLTTIAGHVRALQIAHGIGELTEHLIAHPAAAVIVQGDTNSTSIGAQTASYLGIPVVHVEAGLRSHDRAMPEELNRLLVGALTDVHCAATPFNRDQLIREGVAPERVHVTGNTVVEATLAARRQPHAPWTEMVDDSTRQRGYVLATIHRPENTDDRRSLERILTALRTTSKPVVLALHPRTARAIEHFGLSKALDGLEILTGLGHAEFLELAAHADLIISDSGGVQEEVTVLKKPLIVVRASTERPESIDTGFSILVTPNDDLATTIDQALAGEIFPELTDRPSPYGDGHASRDIANIACDLADAQLHPPTPA
ncbi:non-hydrolyzing UDP-N-acetylglucosamine 2-epimerase [Oerskovia sp. Root22]|uniref:non-hydrolyzing UDP-N-acetylglucosamine 2-epimerase n=1 Tax=Oerskovia sp. Root22 TaxID=1736494 RepID=UPI0006F8815D|nr:UDP-N-acetylglucosamine 2-epimerase (non-hydrolyzing) [Oerskovia sp. Root22]KRC42974.1 hypothetical protein ASE15_03155 [Oerskovia sp. Root22]